MWTVPFCFSRLAGKKEGLAKARQALASAQSPAAKDEAQTCVRPMEARLAAAKTNQNKPAENKP